MKFEGTADYVATPDLTIAVQAAIALEQPLLVKGEPGTGKTDHGVLLKNGQDLHVFERLAFLARIVSPVS